MFVLRLVVWLAVGLGLTTYASYYVQTPEIVEVSRDLHLRQFENVDEVPQAIRSEYWNTTTVVAGSALGWIVLGLLLFSPEISKTLKQGN